MYCFELVDIASHASLCLDLSIGQGQRIKLAYEQAQVRDHCHCSQG